MNALAGIEPALDEFCAAWLEREPALLLACQFAPAGAERARFLATQVLLRELCEAAVGVSDAAVAQAKLGWWLQEAAAWSAGHPRHPLALGLPAPTAAPVLMALAAGVLDWLEAPSADSATRLSATLDPLAAALSDLHDSGDERAVWRTLWLVNALRLSRGTEGLASSMPLDLLARHGRRRSDWMRAETPVRRALMTDLIGQWPRASLPARTPALRVMHALELRALNRMMQGADPAQIKLGPLDAFAAWRTGRSQAT